MTLSNCHHWPHHQSVVTRVFLFLQVYTIRGKGQYRWKITLSPDRAYTCTQRAVFFMLSGIGRQTDHEILNHYMRSHHGTQERTKHFVTRVTFVLMDCVLTACGSCICMQAANAYLKLLKCNSRFFDICQIFSRRPDSSLVSRHVIHFRVEMGYNFSDWNWLIFTLVIYQY